MNDDSNTFAKFDVNEEDWSNAELSSRSSYEGFFSCKRLLAGSSWLKKKQTTVTSACPTAVKQNGMLKQFNITSQLTRNERHQRIETSQPQKTVLAHPPGMGTTVMLNKTLLKPVRSKTVVVP